MNNNIYVDSMIDQRRTAGLNRRLEYRRVAEERGTLGPVRLGLVARLSAVLTHRTPRRHVATQRTVRHA